MVHPLQYVGKRLKLLQGPIQLPQTGSQQSEGPLPFRSLSQTVQLPPVVRIDQLLLVHLCLKINTPRAWILPPCLVNKGIRRELLRLDERRCALSPIRNKAEREVEVLRLPFSPHTLNPIYPPPCIEQVFA